MAQKTIFFYGLFMDPDLLVEQGFDPGEPVIARLQNYGLIISERATMRPNDNDEVWGTLMRLSVGDLVKLYNAPSVSDYQPTNVQCQSASGNVIEAITYILPNDHPLPPPQDDGYARTLISICKKIGLPASYISEIELKYCTR